MTWVGNAAPNEVLKQFNLFNFSIYAGIYSEPKQSVISYIYNLQEWETETISGWRLKF